VWLELYAAAAALNNCFRNCFATQTIFLIRENSIFFLTYFFGEEFEALAFLTLYFKVLTAKCGWGMRTLSPMGEIHKRCNCILQNHDPAVKLLGAVRGS
jgi:hypothetical protein